MRSDGIGYLAAALVAGLLIAVLPGCEGESEPALIASAKSLLENKDPKSAIIQLKTALQKNPQSGEARYLLGQTLLNAGDAHGAILELNKARELKFDDNILLPTLAKALLARGQAKKVSDDFGAATLSDRKTAADLRSTVALAFFQQGMLDQARVVVSSALQLDPRNLAARLLQARLVAGRGEFDQAMGMAEAVIVDEPKQPEPWILKGELLWIGKSDAVGGEKAFHQALALDPTQLRAHEALIHLLLQKGDVAGFEAQIAALRRALPNRIEALFYGTQLAVMVNDPKKAQEGAQQLLKVSPESPQILQLAGIIELRSGATSQAQTHLKQAIQIDPNAVLARVLLAETHLRSGQSNLALMTLKPILDVAKPAPQALALAAQAYLQDGDMAKAEAYYAQAAKADPEDPKARVALALTQIGKGNANAGYAQLESLAAADKTTYSDLALIAARVRGNDLDAALRAVESLQAKVSTTALPYVLRGRIQMQRRDAAAARVSFEKALSIEASNFNAVSGLAAIDVAEKKPDDARKRFEAFLAREPKSLPARMAFIELHRRAGAKPNEVEAMLTAAIASSPDEPAPRLELVRHHLALRHAKAALSAAQDAKAAFPDNLLVLDAVGRSQLAAGDSLQAVQTFQRIAASQTTTPLPHLRLAETYLASKDYVGAEKSLKAALDISPKFVSAQLGLIQVMVARKRLVEALAVARQIQKQRPREAVGYLAEGELEAGKKAWDPAIVAFRAAFQRERSTEVAVRLHAMYTAALRPTDAARLAAAWEAEKPRDVGFILYLGELAMSRQEFAEAELRYRQLLALRGDSAMVLNNIAWSMLKQGKLGALPLAERANQLAPDQATFMDTLASALAAEKRLTKAIEWQSKAVAKDAEAPGMRLKLAKLLIEAGDRTKARAELQKLAALGGRFARQAEVEALLKGL